MTNSPASPETNQPVEVNKSPELASVKDNFQQTKDRFGATAGKLRSKLERLRYTNPTIDLNPEIAAFNDQTAQLMQLDNTTGQNLKTADIENRDEAAINNVRDILEALPRHEIDLGEIITRDTVSADEVGEIRVAYDVLVLKIREVIRDDDMSPEDKQYARFINSLLQNTKERNKARWVYTISAEDLPLLAAIAREKDAFIYPGDNRFIPTPQFIEKVIGNGNPTTPVAVTLIKAVDSRYAFTPAFGWRHVDSLDDSGYSYRMRFIKALPEDFIQTLPVGEQRVIHFVKQHDSKLSFLRPALVEDRKEVDQLLTQEGLPTPLLFELTARSTYRPEELPNEVLATFPDQPQHFWTFLRNQPERLQRFVIQRALKTGFSVEYAESMNEGYAERIQKEYLLSILKNPEVTIWNELGDVFAYLRDVKHGEIRADAYLRIAVALRNTSLTQRTEVEEFERLQALFAYLYRDNMQVLEKSTWNLLRRELPFTTDHQLMEDMRGQAVVVAQKDWDNLDWVHQAIHNYVRISTPGYIRTLRLWIETGEDRYLTELQQLSEKYPQEAQIPSDLPSKRDSLRGSLEEIKKLEELTSLYYEVRPEKLASAVRDVKKWRLERYPLAGDLDEILALIQKAKEYEDEGDIVEAAKHYGQFLVTTPLLRERLLEFMGPDPREKAVYLILDNVLSEMFQKTLPKYVDTIVKPRLGVGNLTVGEGVEFMQIFNSTIRSAVLEGEDITGELKGAVFSEFANPRIVSNALAHRAQLILEGIKVSLNEGWGRFMSTAAPEMIQMLEDIGMVKEDAIKRVYDTDLIAFKKASYSFHLEDLSDVASSVLTRLEAIAPSPDNISIPFNTEGLIQATQISEGIDEKVQSYIRGRIHITSEEIPQEQAHGLISQLARGKDAQAEKYCRMLVKGYVDKKTLQRKEITFRDGDRVVKFIPYTLYGVDGVVITINDEIVDDPVGFIKDRYKAKIVPAMERVLKEGD